MRGSQTSQRASLLLGWSEMQKLHAMKVPGYQFMMALLVQLLRQGGAASGVVGDAGGVSRERDS